jgi:hypothetical protein
MSDHIISATGPTAVKDAELCCRIGEQLTRLYPGHMWRVGADHRAGTIVVDLPYQKIVWDDATRQWKLYRNHAFMLHIQDVLAQGGEDRVMRAGGEMLERFGLKRSGRDDDARFKAWENGFTIDNSVTKSRH